MSPLQKDLPWPARRPPLSQSLCCLFTPLLLTCGSLCVGMIGYGLP
ncbi:unnamed protein product, partial [Gulo gulo]